MWKVLLICLMLSAIVGETIGFPAEKKPPGDLIVSIQSKSSPLTTQSPTTTTTTTTEQSKMTKNDTADTKRSLAKASAAILLQAASKMTPTKFKTSTYETEAETSMTNTATKPKPTTQTEQVHLTTGTTTISTTATATTNPTTTESSTATPTTRKTSSARLEARRKALMASVCKRLRKKNRVTPSCDKFLKFGTWSKRSLDSNKKIMHVGLLSLDKRLVDR